MTIRPYDILVYGATGFTGKRVAKYLVENYPSIKLAISGRNPAKLTTVANEIGLSSDHVHAASTDDQSKAVLESTLSKAKIVIACAGPFRHFGEAIVQAAIASKTDYLDLCGEPQFFDDMLAKYDQTARENSTLIVSACAFDCVPAELCAQFAKRITKERYPDSPVTNIEIVHTFHGASVGNPTTYHAAVDGFHASMSGELKASREKVKKVLKLPKIARPDWPKFIASPGNAPLYHKDTNTYLMKFVGADAACILASDRYLRYRTKLENESNNKDDEIPPHPHLSLCFGLEQKTAAYKTLAYGAAFSLLARFDYGCRILHDNPELFTNGCFRKGGPTEEEMANTSFKTHCTAYGKNKKERVNIVCEGPEPGYVATPRIIVALALTVLNHRDKLRYEGGVMVPGVAFGECNEVYDKLKETGVEIKVVDADPSIV